MIAKEKPNILFLFSDQHNRSVAGAYGDPVAETANIDGLARQGIVFENCHTPSPLCAPARMAMLTARYPHRTRVWTNNDVLSSDIPTYAHGLGAIGLQPALAGRLHALGPDQNHGFVARYVGDHSPNWPGVARHDMGILRRTHGPNRISIEKSGAGHSAYQSLDAATTEAAIGHLRSVAAARRAGDRTPFFLSVGFMLPHPPYVANELDYERFRGRVRPPKHAAPTPEHPWLAWWRESRGIISQVHEADVERARTAYYALVYRLDQQIGSVLQTLDDLGLRENTLIVYASDHGDHLGERGLWWKHTFHDESITVPLIMSWPGVLPEGERRDHCVDLLDVAATFLDAAGAPRLPNSNGRSLLPLALDAMAEWDNTVFSEYCIDTAEPFAGGRAVQQRMVRQDQWKLVYYHGFPPQLFDLRSDPGEIEDRSDDPDCADIRDRLLRRVLEGWDPEAIYRIMQDRLAEKELLRAWAVSTDPPDAIRWQFAPDDNRLGSVR